ncbi:hypothetical protein HMPREF9997_00563 [Corynebacterium durum F0235]|uniref:Uncharacterized protein n=1 Tax=Corynebacterium durum F0235 TaxID=1035195 RepID=L1MJM8_9CORY|nr:hypothetical protein HMPREF9997_00563 [Corynebacterium durum F0235]
MSHTHTSGVDDALMYSKIFNRVASPNAFACAASLSTLPEFA